MKTYGEVEVQLHAFLALAIEVKGQLHALAALAPRKQPPVPTGYEARWASEPVWTQWKRKKEESLPCPYRESNTGRPAST